MKRGHITEIDPRILRVDSAEHSAQLPAGYLQLAILYAPYAAWIYFGFALLVLGSNLFHILRDYTAYPFGDHWIWLARLNQEGAWTALTAQYNEHRLTVPGILYLLDHRLFGSANRLLIGASIFFQLGCAFFLITPVLRRPEIPRSVKLVFSGLVMILAFWFIQGENFYYPFSLCMASSNLGILAALYCMGFLAEDSGSSVWRARLLVACVVVAALWAEFSYGHGLLIWPLLALLGWIVGLPRRWSLLILGLFVAAWGLYFIGYRTPAGHASPIEALKHPVRVAHYLLLMMGLPFFGADKADLRVSMNVFSYAVSSLGILTGLFCCLRFAFRRGGDRSHATVFYTSVMALSLGAALITALNRSMFPTGQALSGRYSAVPLLFWISLAALGSRFIARWETNGGLGRAIWCGVLAATSLGTLPEQSIKGGYFAIRSSLQNAAAASLAAGSPDQDAVNVELANLQLVNAVDKRWMATSGGRSLFARPESEMVGKPLLSSFRLAPPDTCSGAFDLATPFQAASKPAVKIIGWAWKAKQQGEVARIFITDDHNVVRGFGVKHMFRPDVANAFANESMTFAGFQAYAPLPPEYTGTFTVFADLGDGQNVCQIGVPRLPGPK